MNVIEAIKNTRSYKESGFKNLKIINIENVSKFDSSDYMEVTCKINKHESGCNHVIYEVYLNTDGSVEAFFKDEFYI